MSELLVLGLATLPLVGAPLVYIMTSRRPVLASVLDGFVLASIGVLVAVHLLPHAVEHVGAAAILAAILGLATPLVLERVNKLSARSTHGLALGATLIGLAFHATVDGVALATAEGGQAEAGAFHLVAAVILHRLPVGLAIWWLVRPRWGAVRAWAVLCLVVLATVIGFLASQPLWEAAHGSGINFFQAYVAGLLLHVLFHDRGGEAYGSDDEHGHEGESEHGHGHGHGPEPSVSRDSARGAEEIAHGCGCGHDAPMEPEPVHDEDADGCGASCGTSRPRWAWAETLGALCGVALVVAIDRPEQAAGAVEHVHGFGERFLELSLESAPALTLGFLLAGAVSVFLPKASLRWLRGGRPPVQALKGMAFGLPLPICSCGVVPMYQSLVRQGAPPTAAMTFLIATPEIGIEAIALSVPFLGIPLTAVRLGAAAIVAVAVGWLVGRSLPAAEVSVVDQATRSQPTGAKVGEALRFGFVEIVDETAAWLLAGLAIAAMVEPSSLSGFLATVPSWAEVLGFAALGLPIYVCASGATPLAAAMILAGASPGAALAFLLAGPATNVTTYGVLARLHGAGRAVAFGAGVFTASVLCGIAVDALLPSIVIPVGTVGDHVDGSPLAWLCLAALTVAFAAAVFRQGPRAFLSTVVSFGEDEHDHP